MIIPGQKLSATASYKDNNGKGISLGAITVSARVESG